MTFEYQRWVFREARKRGWKGYEPSALGSPYTEMVFEEAKQYLIDLGVSYKQAHFWFSGTCPGCGAWSPEWDEYSTTKVKCPECGHIEDVSRLKMNREKKRSGQ